MKAIMLALATTCCATPAWAHDHWINWGGYRGPDGVHCCGPNDCEAVPDPGVKITRAGYALSYRSQFLEWHSGGVGVPVVVNETVPFTEAQSSEDSHYWRCQRSDNTRRCFFAPQPGS